MLTPAPTRSRDATATRSAILASAREAFARSGYDGAGVREIAGGAGVTAMMVNRYFGSKEALYAEVLDQIFGGPRILTEALIHAPDAARILAEAVVDMTAAGAPQLDGFVIPLRSASNPRALEMARDRIEANHQADVAGALTGPGARERAGLILAVVAGLQSMRQTVEISSLVDADRDELIRQLAGIFSGLIAG